MFHDLLAFQAEIVEDEIVNYLSHGLGLDMAKGRMHKSVPKSTATLFAAGFTGPPYAYLSNVMNYRELDSWAVLLV